MILHGAPDYIGYFVEAAIIHFTQRMHDAPLNGFESVFNPRHRALKDNVRGIIEEPFLIKALQWNGVYVTRLRGLNYCLRCCFFLRHASGSNDLLSDYYLSFGDLRLKVAFHLVQLNFKIVDNEILPF
jgi:hypothetical protein